MSDELQLFNSHYAKVTIDKKSNTATIIWKRQAVSDEFWEASHQALQYIALGNTRYCIFVHQDTIRIPQEHRLWLKYIGIPEALKFGVKRLATLSSHNLAFRTVLNMQDVLFGSKKLHHRCFSDKDAMCRWLYRA